MRKSLVALLMMLLLVVAAACGSSDASEEGNKSSGSKAKDDEVIKLTMASSISESGGHGQGMIKWAEELEKRTEGRVVVEQMTWSGAVLNANNNLEGLGEGMADVAFISVNNHPDKTPLTNALIPAFLNDFSAAVEVQNELWETVPELRQEWLDHNVVPVAWFHGTNAPIMTTFEMDIHADKPLNAKKLFAMGTSTTEKVKRLGGIPVLIQTPDIYASIDKGALDGITTAAPHALKSLSWAEVVDYVYDFRNGGSSLWVGLAFNADVYNSLPDDIKEIIKEISHIPADVHYEVESQLIMEGFALAKENGVELVQLTPEEAEILTEKMNKEEIWEEGLKAAEEAGYSNARELLDKMVELFEKHHDPNRKTLMEQFLEQN